MSVETPVRVGLRAPLRLPDFRWLFAGGGLALLADQMFFVALTLLVTEQAGVGAQLGGVLTAASVPGAVLMLAAGWLADRVAPARVLTAANTGRAVLMGILAALVLTSTVEVWHLYVLAGALGVVDAVHYPASLAAVPSVVADRRLLVPANSLGQGVEQLSGLAGPALAAILAASAGLGATFAAIAGLFAAAAVLFQRVRAGRTTAAGPRSPEERAERAQPATPAATPATPAATDDLWEGVRTVWRDPVLRSLTVLLGALDLATTGPVLLGGAALAEERLGGAGALGALLAAFGAGALLGLLVAGTAPAPRRRGVVLLVLTGAIGVLLAGLGLAPGLLGVLGLALAAGVADGYLGVVLVAWLQERTDPGRLGRVMSVVVFVSVALDPVSYALAGALLAVDAGLLFPLSGAAVVAVALAGAASPALRRLR